MLERQLNVTQSSSVVNPAAINAGQRPPFMIQNPHNALSVPKIAPDIRAVLAAAGFEANPAKPHTIKKIPYPIYQRPMLRNYVTNDGSTK
jgi:hypothetical protein